MLTVRAMPPEELAAWGGFGGALATAAAVGVALWVAIRDGRVRTLERRDREAGQARTVTAHIESKMFDTFDSQREEFMEQIEFVRVENHGALPVTDVIFHTTVEFLDDRGTAGWFPTWSTVRPFVERSTGNGYLMCAVLGAGESFDSPPLGHPDGAEAIRRDIGVEFSFVDAQGLRWSRVKNGPPRRILDRNVMVKWPGARRTPRKRR